MLPQQLIEIWETYLLQLDAEEDGVPFGHPGLPAGVVAAPSTAQQSTSEPAQPRDDSSEDGTAS